MSFFSSVEWMVLLLWFLALFRTDVLIVKYFFRFLALT